MDIDVKMFNDGSFELIDELEKFNLDDVSLIRFDYLCGVNSSKVGNECLNDSYIGEVKYVLDSIFWELIGDCRTRGNYKVAVIRCIGNVSNSDVNKLVTGLLRITNNYAIRVAIVCDKQYTKRIRNSIWSIAHGKRSNDVKDTVRKFKCKRY